MTNVYYVRQTTAAGRCSRAGDWRKNTGTLHEMHVQAHRLAHLKAAQTFGAYVGRRLGGYIVEVDAPDAPRWIASYDVQRVPEPERPLVLGECPQCGAINRHTSRCPTR